jgi:predicted short-subunit dehydrogenase-like oxidoreductase (DUF2520 family)
VLLTAVIVATSVDASPRLYNSLLDAVIRRETDVRSASFNHHPTGISMGELERHPTTAHPHPSLAIIGRGRLGNALAGALRAAGVEVRGPLGRGELGVEAALERGRVPEAALERRSVPEAALQRGSAPAADSNARGDNHRSVEAVLLCVPDSELAAVAGAVAPGPLVGHCSGATGLEPLAPHERFSLHPLISVTRAGAAFAGAAAAIAASSARAHRYAAGLARTLGMVPVELAEADRTAYHAAASIASNYLVTLEAAAERLAATTGLERGLLVPLVRQTVENWAALGPQRALTGPIARGDEATVAAQRAAVAQRAPELLGLFDELAEATRRLAATGPLAAGPAPEPVR